MWYHYFTIICNASQLDAVTSLAQAFVIDLHDTTFPFKQATWTLTHNTVIYFRHGVCHKANHCTISQQLHADDEN